ncbi:DGQHR domain-containing protein [Halieaceae bacterium IMCC14734]|uniref:DGQHR domain-containing protein n=1 Tax=Candidatus Litorirhabdus singularis TaxID=2518993 RepID=A0ABT3TNC1_9GAMM|nr:DGQHR domain-containing protein [Candidatus Litorirhabdus singularis]MCX2982874.1 DGQHR domain-containing protein [Candidatus Litorirhabdus singularis]
MDYFYSEDAILVEQPFGSFYIAVIPASQLVEIAYSLPATYGELELDGVQRGLNKKRVESIARFCKTENALFPNSIILAANILEDGSAIASELAWTVLDGKLNVPTEVRAASIVDGQHRIEGLKLALAEGLDDFDLVCSIYFDLPAPRQAEVFATINFNQQKVDKSLAYQLFGYDLDSSDPKYWAPDTLAISLTRILNNNDSSPFKNHVSYGTSKKYLSFTSEKEEKAYREDPWKISTSTMVEGISKLISSNATVDRYELHKKRVIKRDRSVLRENKRRASEPWRDLYLSYCDAQLYDIVEKYFKAVEGVLWAGSGLPILRKTIGIQALFDLLKVVAEVEKGAPDFSVDEFSHILEKVDLNDVGNLETNYSGSGRSLIKQLLVDACFPGH